MSSLTPPARLVDPRGQRFGAGVSAVILITAIVTGAVWVVALVALALGVSSAFGTRYWILGRPWPAIRALLRLDATTPEHEYPPRFAQAMGATFLGLALILFVLGLTPLAWLPVVAVAGLQTLLAATGYCLGCRMYFLRWWVPSLFARMIGAPSTPSIRLSRAGRG
ncbi:MAG TPA: DUF4395 domain-containing protein [Candidatus Saccharimonadales bacterium]|nr:DUF4395 domain-containing protein [Candidatus Saccharimonadales bacterium]